jgi:hypothetical protein
MLIYPFCYLFGVVRFTTSGKKINLAFCLDFLSTYVFQYHLMLANSISTSFKSQSFFNSLSVSLLESSTLNLLVHDMSRIAHHIKPLADALLLKRCVSLLRRENTFLYLPVQSFPRRLHLRAALYTAMGTFISTRGLSVEVSMCNHSPAPRRLRTVIYIRH